MPDHKGCFQEGLTLAVSMLFPEAQNLSSLAGHRKKSPFERRETVQPAALAIEQGRYQVIEAQLDSENLGLNLCCHLPAKQGQANPNRMECFVKLDLCLHHRIILRIKSDEGICPTLCICQMVLFIT